MVSSVNAFPIFRSGEPELERVNKLNALLRGKMNCSGSGLFTLNTNSTHSTLRDALITVYSLIDFRAATTQASSAQGTIYVISQATGVATVGHISSAATPMTFRYAVLG